MAKRLLKDWTWFMNAIRINPDNLVLKGARIEGFEADVLKISKYGYTIEYEIKISRGDYSTDTLKTVWHRKNWMDPDSHTWRVFKHDLLKSGEGANKFYYVVPDGMVDLDEVPSYAGLIYVAGQDFRVIRPAPTLGNIRRRSMYERYKKKSPND